MAMALRKAHRASWVSPASVRQAPFSVRTEEHLAAIRIPVNADRSGDPVLVEKKLGPLHVFPPHQVHGELRIEGAYTMAPVAVAWVVLPKTWVICRSQTTS